LDFSTIVTAGPHVLEVVGGEGCCDGNRRWHYECENMDESGDVSVALLPNMCRQPILDIMPICENAEPDIYMKTVYLDHSPADLAAFRTVLQA
jgi:hypothetical protein